MTTATALTPSQLRVSSFVASSASLASTSIDLRSQFPPVLAYNPLVSEESGAICTAFQFLIPGGFVGSRMFLDYVTQQYLVNATADEKRYPTDTCMHYCIQALETYGLPLETDWPSNSQSVGTPPASCYASALSRKLLEVINVVYDTAFTQMKACLLTSVPWVVAVQVFQSWYLDEGVSGKVDSAGNLVRKGTGLVPQNYQPTQGDHQLADMTVCMVGFDDAKQYWIARTSLGPNKGDQGYYYFPYSYLGGIILMDSNIWSLRKVSVSLPVDCTTKWTLGTCTAPTGAGTCGWTGFRTDTETITTPASNGGMCFPVTQKSICIGPVCPVNCVVDPLWTNGQCMPPAGAASCGWTGTRTDTRQVVTHASNGGTPCPPLSQQESCAGPACNTDCAVDPSWTIGHCMSPIGAGSCGWTGTQTDTRQVLTKQSGSGKACPALSQQVSCLGPVCPVDCAVESSWTIGQCMSPIGAAACGWTGTQTDTRKVVTKPSNGGAACPSLSQQEICQGPSCPVDCVVSSWSDWSPCSSNNCGTDGIQSATRSITTPAVSTGQACPALVSTRPCHPSCSREVHITLAVFAVVMFLLMVMAGALTLL